MSWAARKRLKIVLIIGILVALVVALSLYLSLHRAPSCVDGIENGTEQGIDCGGSCPTLCAAAEQAPVVRFTQTFPGLASSTDVLAYVDNPNQGAYAKNVSYTISLYSASSTLIANQNGTLDLAPGATTPVFVANIPGAAVRAYLAIASSSLSWQAGAATVPSVESPTLGGSDAAPRVLATLTNPTALPMHNVAVVAALFDKDGNVITASRTLLAQIPGQGSGAAVFAWNAPFAAAPVRIDILPVPQL